MGLLDLPPELLTHIMHHLDVVGLWQLTLCCKVLAELGLSGSVLSALVRGYRSPLLRLKTSTDPAQLHLQGRRDLLKTELDSSLGRLDNKSVSKALALHVRSLNSRFEASVSEKIAQVWDRYTGELLVTEPLQTCSGLVFLQPVWSGDALYLTDTCLIIARASSSKLLVECIDFTSGGPSTRRQGSLEPLTTFSHRGLTYEMGPGRICPSFNTRHQRLTVRQYWQASFQDWQSVEWQGPRGWVSTPQKIEHWDLSTLLAGEAKGPSLSLTKLGALCDGAYNDEDLGLLFSEQAEFQGVPGARVVISSGHEPPETLPRRRGRPRKWHGRGENLLCLLDFLNMDQLNEHDRARKNIEQTPGRTMPQMIPLWRPWYVHVFDFRNLVPFKWPMGAEFHFSGPDHQEIEWRSMSKGGLFCFQDGYGNAWLARRGKSALKPFPRQDNSNFRLWELFVNRPRVSTTDWE